MARGGGYALCCVTGCDPAPASPGWMFRLILSCGNVGFCWGVARDIACTWITKDHIHRAACELMLNKVSCSVGWRWKGKGRRNCGRVGDLAYILSERELLSARLQGCNLPPSFTVQSAGRACASVDHGKLFSL